MRCYREGSQESSTTTKREETAPRQETTLVLCYREKGWMLIVRPPISILDDRAAVAWETVLQFHLPEQSVVLDPTYGTGRIWGGDTRGHVVCAHDILADAPQDLFTLKVDHPEYISYFDGVVYDPPFLVDVMTTKDPRAASYGGYGYTDADLRRYMGAISDPLVDLLKPGGKFFVKCGDQYISKRRQLKLWHVDWVLAMQGAGLEIVDIFITRNRRISPTAYQVKNRPSNILVHGYFLVGKKPTD